MNNISHSQIQISKTLHTLTNSQVDRSIEETAGPANAILQTALAYRRAGFSLIPVSRRHKVPAGHLLPQIPDATRVGGTRGTWKLFQRQIPDEGTINYWFGVKGGCATDGHYNIALVCGAVSGGLVVFDFDEDAPTNFAIWAEQVGPLVRRLPIARSSRGFHVYFRCKHPGKNRVLAAAETGRIFIEARAEGGTITAPPSVHQSGAVYRWCQGNHTTVPFLTQPAVDSLHSAAARLDQRPPKQYRRLVVPAYDTPGREDPFELDDEKHRRLNAYAAVVLKNARLELTMAQGQRNNTLVSAAFRLARYAAVGLLTQGDIEEALLFACSADGNHLIQDDGESAFWATVRSGYEAGLLNPQDLQALWWRLEQTSRYSPADSEPAGSG